jgi:hypothetical protein
VVVQLARGANDFRNGSRANTGRIGVRILPFSHKVNKTIHAIWHTATLICVIFGLRAIVVFHDKNKLANLFSLHSWLGLFTLCVWFQNYVLGFIYFVFPVFGPEQKEQYLKMHRFLGMMSILVAAATMETGISQKNSTLGCAYNFMKPKVDSNRPAENYQHIPDGCKISSGIGLLILLTAIATCYCLWDFGSSSFVVRSKNEQIVVKTKTENQLGSL